MTEASPLRRGPCILPVPSNPFPTPPGPPSWSPVLRCCELERDTSLPRTWARGSGHGDMGGSGHGVGGSGFSSLELRVAGEGRGCQGHSARPSRHLPLGFSPLGFRQPPSSFAARSLVSPGDPNLIPLIARNQVEGPHTPRSGIKQDGNNPARTPSVGTRLVTALPPPPLLGDLG